MFPQLKELYELLDAKFVADRKGKPVDLQIEAPSGAGKSTIIGYEYKEIEGHYLVEGYVSEFMYLTSVLKKAKAFGCTTFTHEDISKITNEEEFLKLCGVWHQITDRHVVKNAFKPRFDEYLSMGLVLTYPSGFLSGRKYETMDVSGLNGRMLHVRFDSDRDLRRIMTKAHRHNNLERKKIDFNIPLKPITDEIEDTVFSLKFTGRQQNLILNLIECGCNLDTIVKLCDGELLFKGSKV